MKHKVGNTDSRNATESGASGGFWLVAASWLDSQVHFPPHTLADPCSTNLKFKNTKYIIPNTKYSLAGQLDPLSPHTHTH